MNDLSVNKIPHCEMSYTLKKAGCRFLAVHLFDFRKEGIDGIEKRDEGSERLEQIERAD